VSETRAAVQRQEASAPQPGQVELASAADALAVSPSGAAAQTQHDLSDHAQTAHAALRLRQAVARRHWQADLVVVVTWHNKSIGWLAERFPLNHTRFVLFSKGLKSCDADIPASVAPFVAACHAMHNAGGRDAHTLASFIVSYYDNLPRLTFFVQDDMAEHKTVGLRGIKDTTSFETWASLAEAAPFTHLHTCLCSIVIEPTWTLERYGPELYNPMRWFMERFLGMDVAASNWTAVRWPANADLVVPASAIRSRPKELYMFILLIFNGTSPANGQHGSIAADTTVVVQAPLRDRGNLVGMLPMAHVFERLWFAVFDAERYSPSQADYDARALAAGVTEEAVGKLTLKHPPL
jgi:hypothetical protein